MYPNISNISPSTWGKTAWKFIHSTALTYPNNPTPAEKNAMTNFIFSLQYILPCKKCRENFKLELQKYPLGKNIESKQALNTWITKIHNEVNSRLGTPFLTEKDVVELVLSDFESTNRLSTTSKISTTPEGKNDCSKCGKTSSNLLITITLISASILIVGIALICIGSDKIRTVRNKTKLQKLPTVN